jgi:hypothetical protein
LASGEDSLLERLDSGSYRLRQLHVVPGDPHARAAAYEVVVDPSPAPQLTVDQAIERLNTGGERSVFFASPATRRGNVLYRRYDGHYGLITLEEGQ